MTMSTPVLSFQGCDARRYSNGCRNICENKCKLQQCDAFNGSCIYGCTDPNALTIDCLGKKHHVKTTVVKTTLKLLIKLIKLFFYGKIINSPSRLH